MGTSVNQEAMDMFRAVRDNNLEKAQIFFEKSLNKSKHDHNAEELAAFAEALHQAGFLEEAKMAYEFLKKMSPEFEEWDLFLAEIYIDQNKTEEALDILLQFDRGSDLYPHVLLMLADAYQTMGLYEVSEHKLLEASKVLPEEPVIQYALAKLYQASGEYPKAITIFKKLIRDDTQDLWSENLFILLSDCYNAIGEFEEAVKYLEQVPEEEHTSDSLFQLGFAYLQMKEFVRASQIFQDLLEKDPYYMSVYLYLSKALEEEHLLNEAMTAIEKGIEINPYQSEYYVEAANLSLKLNNQNQAEDYLNKAIQLEPESTEAILLKVDFLLERENYEEVIQFLDDPSIIRLPEHSWQLAKAYNGMEDFGKAAELYSKAYLDLSDNLTFMEEYLVFLQEEGQTKKMIQILDLALLLDPENEYFLELKEKLLNEDM